MDIKANAGLAFHAGGHGLTCMLAFANLAAVTHFQRTKPYVSRQLLSVPVSPESSVAPKGLSYLQSREEGRASSPTLSISQICRPAQLSTDFKLVDSNEALPADESPGTSTSSRTSRCGSDYSAAHKTSHIADRDSPRADSRHYTLASNANAGLSTSPHTCNRVRQADSRFSST
jgi:hypothetical protein